MHSFRKIIAELVPIKSYFFPFFFFPFPWPPPDPPAWVPIRAAVGAGEPILGTFAAATCSTTWFGVVVRAVVGEGGDDVHFLEGFLRSSARNWR
ncbi:hypothetical protein BGX38DRAFT_1195872 [Terfezia claveryi]|nr:hypothetical protein BGX38DRAFT_1195872 [Terfezia claveryi]